MLFEDIIWQVLTLGFWCIFLDEGRFFEILHKDGAAMQEICVMSMESFIDSDNGGLSIILCT